MLYGLFIIKYNISENIDNHCKKSPAKPGYIKQCIQLWYG